MTRWHCGWHIWCPPTKTSGGPEFESCFWYYRPCYSSDDVMCAALPWRGPPPTSQNAVKPSKFAFWLPGTAFWHPLHCDHGSSYKHIMNLYLDWSFWWIRLSVSSVSHDPIHHNLKFWYHNFEFCTYAKFNSSKLHPWYNFIGRLLWERGLKLRYQAFKFWWNGLSDTTHIYIDFSVNYSQG